MKAEASFNQDWRSLVESMIQLVLYKHGEKDQLLLLPAFIRSISISFEKLPKGNEVDILHNYSCNVLEADGIQICGIHTEELKIEKPKTTLEQFKFVKYNNERVKVSVPKLGR